jgi:hypothetical protein
VNKMGVSLIIIEYEMVPWWLAPTFSILTSSFNFKGPGLQHVQLFMTILDIPFYPVIKLSTSF